MRGPANPSSNDEYAMLIEGFDSPPVLLMTYNPKYYLNLCDNYGFKKAKDLYAYILNSGPTLSAEKVQRVADIAKKRYGLKISQLNMKDFDNEVEKVKYVYNKAWDELNAMAKDLKPLVEPSLVLFGEIKNELVGFALVMPDYNEIFISMNGKLLPFGFTKLITQKKKIKKCRIITLGIIPEYQKKGLDAAFYWEIVNRAKNIGINIGEASWVLEDNDMMTRGLEDLNGNLYKKYRIYEIDI